MAVININEIKLLSWEEQLRPSAIMWRRMVTTPSYTKKVACIEWLKV